LINASTRYYQNAHIEITLFAQWVGLVAEFFLPTRMYPSSCDTFVALPPATQGQRIVFGKNSDRPCDEVQEVVYFPARDYNAGEKVEVSLLRPPLYMFSTCIL
jgi:hypothetical protein